MIIRADEEKLFKEWIESYKEEKGTFIKDGIPVLEKYFKAEKRILFLLKDANFENDIAKKNTIQTYDQRDEIARTPNKWWDKMRDWCAPLSDNKLTWNEIQQFDTKESLSFFAFMQLKKIAGEGSIKNDLLSDTVGRDREFIKRQIELYTPDFIVCCGNGDIVKEHIFKNIEEKRYTKNGVGYWEVDNNKFLIDYCHPSARFGNKLAPVVALSLTSAVQELSNR
jgi:hypothetical protein